MVDIKTIKLMMKQINNLTSLKLLYRGSRDGFKS